MLKQPEIEPLSDNLITASWMLAYLYWPRFVCFEYIMDISEKQETKHHGFQSSIVITVKKI
ncbi:hypothetical protein BuS5_01600 [Desulfosarcina sp. BuS5]|nr:hypothetical protein BuS5_01600 [Desulfosarcina sp. BuS5]